LSRSGLDFGRPRPGRGATPPPMVRSVRALGRVVCLAGVAAVMCLGCVTSPVMLDRAMILNATHGTVRAVSVLHDPTLKTASVNAIFPGRSLQLGFDQAPMRARVATVRWLDERGDRNKVMVAIPDPPASDGTSMQLIYTIQMDGRVDARLVPSPGQ
jgi:hypothetical protein